MSCAPHDALNLGAYAAAQLRPRREARAAQLTNVRHYRIGPVPVTLVCEDTQIADDFHRYYHSYEIYAPSADSFRIEVQIRRSWRSLRQYYHIRTNDCLQCILCNAKSVLPYIEWTTNALVAKFLPNFYQIHAAAMSRNGVGIIIAGTPGQGKSTLAAGLLARGWSYLSDEFALINPDTRKLEAFPKALCLKAGSFAPVLNLGLPLDVNRVLHKGSKGPVSLLDPLEVRPDAVSKPCRIGAIVFPQYVADSEPAIAPVSRARAVFELVQVSFNFTKFRGVGLELLANIVRQAECIQLRSSELESTCKLVEEYVEQRQKI